MPQTAPPPEPPQPHRSRPPDPPPPPATTTKTTASTTSTTTTSDDGDDDETTPETTTTEKTGSPGQHVKWTVKPGDTLGTIATQFGTTVKELIKLNPDIDPDALQIGQEVSSADAPRSRDRAAAAAASPGRA